MKDRDATCIKKIRVYCEKISATISRFGDDFELFCHDNDFCASVSMHIMQIGEISIRLTDDFKQGEGREMQWGLIRGMRNMFAHGYEDMKKDIIWEVATRDVPTLHNFCNRMLEQSVEQTQLGAISEKSSIMEYLKKTGDERVPQSLAQPQPTKKPDPER